MGKSGGGGGGGGGKINIPPALGSNQGSLYYNAFNPLGTFGSSTLSNLLSMSNWAQDIATGGNVMGDLYSSPGTGTLTGLGSQTYAPFTGAGGSGGGGGSGINPFNGGSAGGGGGYNPLLGPILGGEFSALGGMGQTAGNLAQEQNLGSKIFGQGTNILDTGNRLVQRATTGSGLFPSQQAMINQSVASQQAATQQQLGNMGLGSSTVAKQLAGQISLSGAAAAGQLVQGNLQLGEEEQQIGLQGEQTGANVTTQMNEALYNEYAGIASQSQSLQNQMYSQALAGYGALGNMMNETLSAFGYSMRTQEDVLGANENEAAIQAKVSEAAAQASAGGFSSLMGGLGSLLGGSGGSGGLLGGLGGLLGGGGAGGLSAGGFLGTSAAEAGLGTGAFEGAVGSALGSTAAAGGAAAGGGAGIIGAIGAIFSVFCMIAQTAYGLDDPRWILFRHFLLFRSPRWFRKAYVDNAPWLSRLIKKHKALKWVVKELMNLAIWYDEATREI